MIYARLLEKSKFYYQIFSINLGIEYFIKYRSSTILPAVCKIAIINSIILFNEFISINLTQKVSLKIQNLVPIKTFRCLV